MLNLIEHYRSALILPILLLSSCANLTHYTDKNELDSQSAVFVDAKQRGIYSVSKAKNDGTLIWKGVCAEPSPDAISALASGMGLDLNVSDKGTLGVSHSISEGVGTLGIRTAAIAALRDIMYRNCEAYALGGISELGIETLQRRFQSTMVAILAIEQLTGAVRAPSVSMNSSSNTGNAELIAKLTTDTETAMQNFNKASDADKELQLKFKEKEKEQNETKALIEKDSKEIEELRKKGTLTEEEKKKVSNFEKLETQYQTQTTSTESAKKEYESAKEVTKLRKSSYDAINAARVKSITAGPSTEIQTSLENFPIRQPLSDASVQSVANATVKIVDSTLNLNFGKELCTTLIGQNKDIQPDGKSALWACISLLLVPDNAEGDEVKKGLLETLNLAAYEKSFSEAKNKSQMRDDIYSYLESKGIGVWRDLVDRTNLDADTKKSLIENDSMQKILSTLDNDVATPNSNITTSIHAAMLTNQ